jgi:hypothetical protein
MVVPVLIISGALGSGQTTMLGELHDLLIERDVAHAAIEVESRVELAASAETMLARLRVREPGTFRATALGRAPVLAQQLAEARVEDFVVDNDDRPVREVAEEILRQAEWR